MSLNYKILEYKNTVSRNGESFIDLASKSFDKDMYPMGTFVVVNQMYVGRPDLISLALYGDDCYADILCKLNGISNPIELNEDDIIFTPNHSYLIECCKVFSPDSDDFVNERDDSIYTNNINQSNNVNKQKQLEDKRSPHLQTQGEQNYVVDRTVGLIFY